MASNGHPPTETFLPEHLSLAALRRAVDGCRGCDLYENATQGVIGEGPAKALALFVGEQPGDQEDLAGRPFVGPAGGMLDRGLEAAGIPRDEVFVTNAVKHFKWVARGKRRLHQKPTLGEVTACRPWLAAEVAVVAPRMIVCLGATAAQALLGRDFRVTRQRGEIFEGGPDDGALAPWMMATIHPSALLRIPGSEDRQAAFAEFVGDLEVVARQLEVERERA
ncbi:MAG TPA: UdgX family uracil-DNA binding protein [Thermoanaerobaculia bacterium]|nr:UdgX family uracil-DNA binding protein [Thermoanaerobaculia bacterium]